MSEVYDYRAEMYNDIEEYIAENGVEDYDTLYDDMFVSDYVTGNASGSYFFNSWKAEEALCHNFDLMMEAYNEFGMTPDYTSAEAMDVTIRCYLLGEVLSEVLENLKIDDRKEG